jgi:uncharacterized protein (TIGR04222 family)
MSLGPFDLAGGPFLTLYIVLLVPTLLAGFLIPPWLRPEGRSGRVTDPGQLALLAGGRQRFYDTSMTRLLAADALKLIGGKDFLAASGARGHSVPDDEVLALARRAPASLKSVERVLQPHAAATESDLVDAGLLIDRDVTAQLRFWQTSPYLLLLLFGMTKLWIGVARERPVGFLIALLFVTAIAALLRFTTADRRTRAGKALLDGARDRSDRLRRAPTRDEAALGVALFGTGVLLGSAWSDYHGMRRASDGGGGFDGGSGSSGDGGCGGGGGGGGCGGCGS